MSNLVKLIIPAHLAYLSKNDSFPGYLFPGAGVVLSREMKPSYSYAHT
jgi:hypothetical protein